VTPQRGKLLRRHAGKKGKLFLRSRVACGGWIMILAVLLASVFSFSETEVQMLLMLSMVYGLQGWLAELIGVKIDASGISFPNRVFPQFPYLVLFRRTLSKGSFDRVNFVRKQSSLVIYSAGEQVTVPITTRFNGIAVAKCLRNEFPKVSVTLLY
jgi:UDP-N-acetylmuramyl pentapeptide phosphotransferase/UDP-N-acetylglucosamine-1-phosphate transferase